MSGPKVVRIVTREEVLAICEAALARVDAALAEWERIGNRNGVLDEQSRAAMKARRQELARLLAADRHLDVQKQAPMLEDFVRQDLDARLEEKLSGRVREERARRSVATTAATLLKACAEQGVDLPEEVKRGLERGEEAAVSRAFRQMGTAAQGLTTRQRALASRLAEAAPRATLDEWLASDDIPDERLDLAERAILRLEQMEGDAVAYQQRLATIRLERDDDRRDLLLDSLNLDLRDAVKRARDVAELRRRAVALAAPEEVRQQVTDGRHEEARAALAGLEEQRQQAAAARAVVEKRRLVLEGLQTLGYDVREGMATAWARNGRVVVRNPHAPATAVELAGSSDRLQMRVVGNEGAPRDAATDKAAEVSWCSDVSRLQALLAEQGGELRIERALAPGQQPLKTVPVQVFAYEEEEAPRYLTAD